MRIRIPLLMTVVVLLAARGLAQDSIADSTLRTANRLYSFGAYDSAELAARRLMEQEPLSDSLHVEAERIIAFSLVAQGKPELAREHFGAILRINPRFQLDQLLTSPKILTVFQEAKLQSPEARRAERDDDGGSSKGTGVTFRAVVFPGWEQYYRGQTVRGLAFVGAGAATLYSAVAFEILRAQARGDYLTATSPADIAAKYKTYNRYYQAEVYSFVAFAVVYIASELDVFLNPPNTVQLHSFAAPSGIKGLVFSIRF